MINYLYFLIITIILTGCSVFGIRSGYETLEYNVVDKINTVEIREYPTRLVAEVNSAKTDNEAFMLLFRYISGENITNQDISMTTPVEVSKQSKKIDMTTPVEVSKTNQNDVSMRFFLPKTYTIENAPKPKDSRIKLHTIPNELFAVATYSGFNSEKNFKREYEKLLKTINNTKWQVISEPNFLGYDPPFTLPFLRKNEVIVKVIKTY